MPRSNMFFFL